MPLGPRPPIPPGHAKCVLSGTLSGHQWRNIFYLKIDGTAVTVNDLTAVALAIANAWNTNLVTLLHGGMTLSEVQIVYIPSVGNELVGVWTGTHTGTNAGGVLESAAACAVVDWAIGAYYRGGHPHLQQGGLPNSVVSNGSDIDSTYRSNLATGWNAIRNAINALTETSITGVTMGTISFATGNSWRTTPLFRAYQSVSIRLKLGSVRRRIFS